MNKEVINIIRTLIELVGIIDERYQKRRNDSAMIDDDIYREKKRELSSLYQSFHQQQELYSVLDTEFADDDKTQIYLLSILLKCTKDAQIIDQIIHIISKGNVDSYYCSVIEYQIAYETFSNSYPKETTYELQRKLHHYNVQRFKHELNVPTEYRTYSSRNKKRIAIVTEQLLDINHAPSKIVLEQCYALQQKLGMEIILFICPIDMSQANPMSWHEMVYQNFMPQLNGEYLIIYDEEGTKASQKEANGIFYIRYKDIIVRGKQILFRNDTFAAQEALLQLIYDYNPLFVYNINSVNPIADICGSFTAVVASCMSYGYPVSDADILLKLQNTVNEQQSKRPYTILEDTQQLALDFQWSFHIDKPSIYYERIHYGIPEDEFVLSIVGNRLQFEITDEFVKALEQVLNIDNRISIMLIGEYQSYKEIFNAEIFENRIHSIGYQNKLASAIKMADLYINPPRSGGGTSALYALNAGVPVITLPDCDVAYNVGEQFICSNYEEMIHTIIRYKNNQEYYETQSRLGMEYAHRISDLAAIMGATVRNIEEIIIKAEEGGIF
jgi:glycosyltransferase involved in cell wall biosynthesis